MTPKFTNNATSVLTTGISDSDLVLQVTAGTGALFPTLGAGEYYKATLQDTNGDSEIIKVTARTGDTMTIVRAQEGTTALPFPAGSRIELRVLASSIEEYVDSIDFLLL